MNRWKEKDPVINDGGESGTFLTKAAMFQAVVFTYIFLMKNAVKIAEMMPKGAVVKMQD